MAMRIADRVESAFAWLTAAAGWSVVIVGVLAILKLVSESVLVTTLVIAVAVFGVYIVLRAVLPVGDVEDED